MKTYYAIYSDKGYMSWDDEPPFISDDPLTAKQYSTMQDALDSISFLSKHFSEFPINCVVMRIDYRVFYPSEIDRPEQLGAIVFNQI